MIYQEALYSRSEIEDYRGRIDVATCGGFVSAICFKLMLWPEDGRNAMARLTSYAELYLWKHGIHANNFQKRYNHKLA